MGDSFTYNISPTPRNKIQANNESNESGFLFWFLTHIDFPNSNPNKLTFKYYEKFKNVEMTDENGDFHFPVKTFTYTLPPSDENVYGKTTALASRSSLPPPPLLNIGD